MNDSQHNYSTIEFYDNNSSSSNNTIKLETLSPTTSSARLSMMDALSNNPILTTASVPIPSRNQNQRIMADLSELIEFESSQSPYMIQDIGYIQSNSNSSSYMNNTSTPGDTFLELQNFDFHHVGTFSTDGINIGTLTGNNGGGISSNTMWNESNIGQLISPSSTTSSSMNNHHGQFHMDEDDILFQVDKGDLISGPTLNELNGDLLLIDEFLPDDFQTISQQIHNLSQSSHNLSNDSGSNSAIHSSPSLPQQLLHQNHNNNNNQNMQQMSGGILISRDSPYDDHTNTSSSPFENYQSLTPTRSLNSQSAAFSPGSHSSNSSLIINSPITPPPQLNNNNVSTKNQNAINNNNSNNNSGNQGLVQHNPKYSTLQQLLMKRDYSERNLLLGQSVPGPASSSSLIMSGTALSPGGFNGRKILQNFSATTGNAGNASSGGSMSRLSSSAPTHLGLEQIWQRREPRPHLLSTGSLAEAGSTSSLSTGGILSPEAPDFSHDEGYSDDDDNDSEHYEDLSSDDSDTEDPSKPSNNNNPKSKRYFWQYNVQAKGPKGQRLVIKTQIEDPHVLNEVTDPVFSPHCSVRGIKTVRLQHSGKARKGDGNDLTPNPKKLHNIGKELDKLGRVINDMTPVSELPFNVRPKTRKEKNKLASRACRLKKKAQHEANKIKLYGLESEHKRLINGLNQMKQMLAVKCGQPIGDNSEEFNQHLEKVVKSATKVKIAGNSTEYVNRILENVKNGVQSGNLDKALEEY